MTPEHPLISCEFVISGDDLDTDDCSQQIGFTATSTWHQRHPHLLERKDIPRASWHVGFKKQPYDVLDNALSSVIAMIWEKRDAIHTYVRSHDLTVDFVCSVTVFSIEHGVEYSIAPETLRKMSQLGAGFALDIYDYTCDSN